jgi:hypothetical protein
MQIIAIKIRITTNKKRIKRMSHLQGDDLDVPKSLLVPHEIVTRTGKTIGNGAYGIVHEVATCT